MVNFNKIYEEAVKGTLCLEPWEGYYLTRKVETEILAEKFNFNKNLTGLELGCGNAFQSALLASLCGRMFATDMANEHRHTHSIGIKKAQELVDKLDVRNVTLLGCSATALPFRDNYFDFILLSSVLEHIGERESALSEIGRVLKPKGYLILIVPTHMASIYAFFHVLIYFLARGLKVMFGARGKTNKFNDGSSADRDNPNASLFARYRNNHPSFPLPEPHGDYPSVFHECLQQLPSSWSSLLKGNGFRIEKSFGTCILPWSLIEPFSTLLLAGRYAGLKKLHSRYGHIWIIRDYSYLICFLAQKA